MSISVVGLCVQLQASFQQVTEGNQTVYHSLPGLLDTNLTGVARRSPAQQLDPLYSPLHLERGSAKGVCVTPAVVYSFQWLFITYVAFVYTFKLCDFQIINAG